MGRYIEWDDVIDRYPVINTLGGSDEVSSAYIVYAEAMTDGFLANKFTVPFSNNNMVVKDLAIDYTYWMAGRFKLEDAISVYSAYHSTIKMLNKGQMKMVDDAGAIIAGNLNKIGIYSSTESYHSSFGMLPVEEQHIDTDNIDDERDW